MAHITRIGNSCPGRSFTKLFLLIALFGLGTATAFGQTCQVAAQLPVVHAEGLAEQIGDITLSCTGGTVGSTVVSYLFINLNATITNAVDANGNLLGIVTTVDTGSGPVAGGLQPIANQPGTLTVNGLKYVVPSPNTQTVTLNISGIRVAVPTLPNSGGTSAPFVTGSIGGGGVFLPNGQSLLLGAPVTTVLSSVIDNGIPCLGSPLPTTTPLTFQSFISAVSSSSTIRLTEGDAASFVSKNKTDPTVTNGIRFVVNLSGYGSNASVYVPDAIVGSTGNAPTSGGAFGTTINAGTYSPGQNQLLLARVNGADANGAGGTLAFTLPGSTTTFSSVTEIPLTSGAGYVVYEVLDSNLSTVEWAQVPVFLVVPAQNCSTSGAVTLGAMPGPISTVATPSQTAPIPRYVATTPGSDCSVIGDCSAPYFPLLKISPTSITLNGSSLGDTQQGFISVSNGGTSQLTFTASTTYHTVAGQSVANWLAIDGVTGAAINGVVDPVNGVTSLQLTLSASPAALLVPGAYNATVTIDAGSAGTIKVPVTFNVAIAGPVIQSIVNSANFQLAPVTINSFVTIFGLNLAKKSTLSVTFDGFPATVSYDSPVGTANPNQINVLVPVGLGISTNAGVIATVDGVVSNTFAVNFVTNAPAVFTPGILNQPDANGNSTVNLSSAPASPGDYVQIFLTGLATPIVNPSSVTVNIGAATGLANSFAGAVPSIPGLEQVNVQVPANLTFSGGSAPLSICIPGTGATPLCSVPVNLYLQ